jgi:hypothetical protein
MAERKEKRFPTLEDIKEKERREKKADKDVYTEDKGPPPSPPDMATVKTMAKGGLVTGRGQGKVMRKKQTRIC